MTVVLFSSLVIQVLDFFKELKNWGSNKSAVLTQALAWIGGIVLVLLAAHAAVAAGVVLPGLGIAIGKLDFGSQILAGMLVSSVASTVYDFKAAIDNQDSAAKPPLVS